MNINTAEFYKNLPVLRAADLLMDEEEVRIKKPGPVPKTFLMETRQFLKYFNTVHCLSESKKLTRRTLQFYSSPQVRLLPLPVYKKRHTAHYVFPHHYRRLLAIWTSREKHFFPIELIRTLLKDMPEKQYDLLNEWGGSAEDLLDTIPLFKAGFNEDDILNYQACKGLLVSDDYDMDPKNYIDPMTDQEFKQHMLEELDQEYKNLKKWISSDRGVRFLATLSKARRDYPDFRERLKKFHGSSETQAESE